MTQFTNATFSVHGKHCNGCSQRDVWLEQANERIKELETKLLGRTYCHDNEAVEAFLEEKDADITRYIDALMRIALNDLGEGGCKRLAREALHP